MQSPVLFLFRKENKSFIAPAKFCSHSSRADCGLSRGTRRSSLVNGRRQVSAQVNANFMSRLGDQSLARQGQTSHSACCWMCERLSPVGGRGATCLQDSIVRDWPEVSVDERQYQDCTQEKEFCLHRPLLALDFSHEKGEARVAGGSQPTRGRWVESVCRSP